MRLSTYSGGFGRPHGSNDTLLFFKRIATASLTRSSLIPSYVPFFLRLTMNLLNTRTLQVQQALPQTPPYAALSGFGDGTFTGSMIPTPAQKQSACTAAHRLGLEWVWLQSLCVDYSSSAEISECVNSLFGVFRDSAVCLVYLEDVLFEAREPVASEIAGKLLRTSRWLQRIWTLPELIASKEVLFFDRNWRQIGTKQLLLHEISAATRIDRLVLEDSEYLSDFSVARKMSWASACSYDRVEDLAYALIGLFGISMMVMYGEGPRAFLRLQEEILNITDDASLFCWQAGPDEAHEYRGLFAHSPAEFSHFASIPPIAPLRIHGDLQLTSEGVVIKDVSVRHGFGSDIVLPLYSRDGRARYGMCLAFWKGQYVKPYLGFTGLDGVSSQTVGRICIIRDVDIRMSQKIATEPLQAGSRRPSASKWCNEIHGRRQRDARGYHFRSHITALSLCMDYKLPSGEPHYFTWNHVLTQQFGLLSQDRLAGSACCQISSSSSNMT